MTDRRPARADVVVAAVLLVVCALDLGLEIATSDPPLSQIPHAARIVTGVALSTALFVLASLWWRAAPLLAAVVAACSPVLLTIVGAPPEALPESTSFPIGLVAYGAASRLGRVGRFTALAVLLAGLPVADLVLSTGEAVVPLTFVVLGPWLVGLVSGSRRRLAVQLSRTARDLAEEQRRYTEAAVLLERRRAARELHDLVGHAMSLVVVQAVAGRHLSVEAPAGAHRSLAAIREATEQARRELAQLDQLDQARLPGVAHVPELVARAVDAGLTVKTSGLPVDGPLSAAVDHTVYRLVQEALTNVVRYAPGSVVRLVLARRIQPDEDQALEISVINSAASAGSPLDPAIGPGSGIAGLRERVAGCGGTLTAGPEAAGWAVRAHIPTGSRSPDDLEAAQAQILHG